MLTHKAIWRGIDLLAERKGFSASGLAKRAGLDPTTFNKSKRTTKQGKSRWPSTESVSKILEATSTSMADFVALIDEGGEGPAPPVRRVRCLSLGQMEREQAFDPAGFPQAGPWEDIEFPAIGDDSAYAVELDRDVIPPVLRAGDMLIVSPRSSVRRHDRVVVPPQDRGGRVRRADAAHGAADRAGPFLPPRRGTLDRRRLAGLDRAHPVDQPIERWPPASRRPQAQGGITTSGRMSSASDPMSPRRREGVRCQARRQT